MPQNSTQYQGARFAVPQELGDTSPSQDGGPGGAGTFTNPPRVHPTDLRAVRDVHTNPHLQFYDPNTLHFPDAQGPLVRGFGGYFSAGIGMVRRDDAARWDRSKVSEAGPVREFFRRILFDNRTKHL